MKAKAGSKHQSNWKNIQVVTKDGILNYELKENGKLKKKLSRQTPRDLSIELQKLPTYNPNVSQPLATEGQNQIRMTPQSFPTTPENSNIQISSHSQDTVESEENMAATTSSNINSAQDLSQTDESPFYSNEYLSIEGVSDSFDLFTQSDETIFDLDDSNIFDFQF